MSSQWLPVALVWLLALGCVVLAKFRGEIAAYKSFHTWMAGRGVPDAVRNLDSLILYTLAAFAGAMVVHWLLCRGRGARPESPAGMLGLRRGRPAWARAMVLALAPMIIGGAVLGLVRGNLPAPAETWLPAVLKGVIRAPIMEELFFRGLLVGVPAAAVLGWMGRGFWINASFAAGLFALMHISWTLDAAVRGWPTLLVTFIGGLWFVWLLQRWRTLWVPMILHAGINLGWLLAGSSGGAGGGGLVENLLRAATITIATWMTVRGTRGRE